MINDRKYKNKIAHSEIFQRFALKNYHNLSTTYLLSLSFYLMHERMNEMKAYAEHRKMERKSFLFSLLDEICFCF